MSRPRRRHNEQLQPTTSTVTVTKVVANTDDAGGAQVDSRRKYRQPRPSALRGRIRASRTGKMAPKFAGGLAAHHVLVLTCLLAYSGGGWTFIQRGSGDGVAPIAAVEAIRLPFLPHTPSLSRRNPFRRSSMSDAYGLEDVQIDTETIDAYRRATRGQGRNSMKLLHGYVDVPRGGAAGLWGSPPEDDSSDIEDGNSNNMAPMMPDVNHPYGAAGPEQYGGGGGGGPQAPPPLPGGGGNMDDASGPPLPPGPGDGYAPNGGMPPPRLPDQGPQQQGGYGPPARQQQQYQQQQQGGGYGPPSQYGGQQQQQQQPNPYGQYEQPIMPTSNTGGQSPTVLDIDSHNPSLQQSQSQQQSQQPDLSNFDKDMIFNGLKKMYKKKILPVEHMSQFTKFGTSQMSASDFTAKPMVLLLGQYSVGKTSFIRYLLGRDFPGIRIGPEPTTDRFVSIMHGKVDKIVPGAALCSDMNKPFRGLSTFGNNFLSRFEGVEMDSPILKNITLVDTPGILSGQKQSIGRNYDYESVMRWFAERADLIIIMFDAHKLDISDELKRVIELMKPHADKVRVVLNKADCVSTQQLMRVYGSLMWSLGKVMMTPEVCRVYMGSFWGAPLQNTDQARLLTQEKMDLFNDIAKLPENAVMRRINELVKRVRSVKVHAYIIHFLRKQMPMKPWGKKEKQRKLIDNLGREFIMCARRYDLARGDFPNVEEYQRYLSEIKDISEFQKLDKKMIKEMDKVFSIDIPALLQAAQL